MRWILKITSALTGIEFIRLTILLAIISKEIPKGFVEFSGTIFSFLDTYYLIFIAFILSIGFLIATKPEVEK